jgi:hypothetical protein
MVVKEAIHQGKKFILLIEVKCRLESRILIMEISEKINREEGVLVTLA